MGQRIWDELAVPVFFYDAAARDPARARLETLRSPSFAGAPDIGRGRHATAGAVIVGARRFLIAWNVNLDSQDLEAARAIARSIRQSSGGLPFVKALGLALQSRNQVQVSINLTDFEATPLHAVFHRIQQEAGARGIRIAGSELIGLIPRRALDLSAGHDLHWLAGQRIQDYVLESRLSAARL
jgi:glutamate formiminotransferase/glutamate formiminotransferase/formiminotetrahydrofolate cyclodeaminase